MPPRLIDLSVRHVVIHGHRRAFIDAGPRTGAPTLLLLHGIGDDLQTWDTVVASLARRFRVIAPDLLGHGQSAKPRADYTIAGFANGMRDLLTHLGVDRVTVVGHSLGGGVAMQLCYQFPERVDRVVLVASGGLGRDVSPLLRLLSLPGAGTVVALAEALPSRLAVSVAARGLRRLRHLPGRPFVDLEEALAIYAHLRRSDARSAFLHVLRGVIDARGQVITMTDRTYLAEGLPVLVLWGDRDPIIPVAHARSAADDLPFVDVAILPGAGHFPHRDDPQWFVDRVTRFVTSTPAAVHDVERWRELLHEGGPRRGRRRSPGVGSGARGRG